MTKPESENATAVQSDCYRDPRTRIERLLNYKRYIDWLIERELKNADKAVRRD